MMPIAGKTAHKATSRPLNMAYGGCGITGSRTGLLINEIFPATHDPPFQEFLSIGVAWLISN
jgi:hypothetical protein